MQIRMNVFLYMLRRTSPMVCMCLALVLTLSACHPPAETPPDTASALSRHPDFWKVIGNSVDDRPIYAHENGTGDTTVLVLGSIHGDEAVTGQVVTRLAEWVSNEGITRAGTKLLFVPFLNPDGVMEQQRTNAHGVDLNRNFPTRNWDPTPTQNRYPPGPAPASEPETRLVLDLLSRFPPRLIISLHAPLRVVNYDGPAEEIANRMGSRNGYRVSGSIGYATPGSLGTYAGVERNIPMITLELPHVGADDAWQQNRDALVDALLRGAPGEASGMITGRIFVIGNEPVTRVGLESASGDIFPLLVSAQLDSVLRRNQGHTMRVSFECFDLVPEGPALRVIHAEEVVESETPAHH
jgi:protein MpaA